MWFSEGPAYQKSVPKVESLALAIFTFLTQFLGFFMI